MPSVRIYHNPRCSKSRQTLTLLEKKGIQPEIVEYLKTPPTADELKMLLTQLGLTPQALMRQKEAEYEALNLANADDDTCIAAMATHPVLIERPIVVNGERAAIGRPPENILEIL